MAGLPDAERTAVWGRSGSGKSAWTKKQIASKKRVIVFDPMDEYKMMKTRIVHDSPDAVDRVRKAMAADPNGFRIAFVPASGKEAAALSHLSNLVWRAQEKGYRAERRSSKQITLVVEEMNLSFKVHGGAEKCPGFANICSRGRAAGIEIIGISQGIAEVSTRFRRNCSKVVVFAQADQNDRKAAAQALFIQPRELENLAALEYIYMENNKRSRAKLTFKKSRKA